jgi:ketosteroid isomerase-like protein
MNRVLLLVAALSTRDLEQLLAHFDDDALVHIANMPPIRGRDAITQLYGNATAYSISNNSQ